jgi:hypothetical protein
VGVVSATLIIMAAGRARRYGGLKPLAPVGIQGEAVIDLIAGDAVASGFTKIVVVINPTTGPEIQAHIESNWPSHVDVSFALQEQARGTVDAVLAARQLIDPQIPFGIANADDLYGADAMAHLGEHLTSKSNNCLIGFRLDKAGVGADPVTRGTCVSSNGVLMSITERRQVQFHDGEFISHDGIEPRQLSPSTTVSMNLWGFHSGMWDHLDAAMREARETATEAEVLLPDLVGKLIQSRGEVFRIIPVESPCIGVTHPSDLPLVQGHVADLVAAGLRPAQPFA